VSSGTTLVVYVGTYVVSVVPKSFWGIFGALARKEVSGPKDAFTLKRFGDTTWRHDFEQCDFRGRFNGLHVPTGLLKGLFTRNINLSRTTSRFVVP
jgi:hypothetical protein